jgi:Flp pilus assembly protein TadD
MPKGRRGGRVISRIIRGMVPCLVVFSPWQHVTSVQNPRPVSETQNTAEYEHALGQVRQHDFQGAIRRLLALVEMSPHDYLSYNLLGVCYDQLGNHEKANEAFIKAVQINPRFDQAYVNLGVNYAAKGRLDEGIAQFRKAIQVNPRSTSAYYNFGRVELQRGRSAEAVEPLKRAHELTPHDSPILFALIRALAQAGETQEAVRLGEEVSQLRPSDADLEMRVGLIFLHSQQWNAAQSHLKTAATSDPTLRGQIIDLGEKAFGRAQYQEALCLINSAVEFAPEPAPIHSMAGACYYQLRNPALAAKEVQEAIHLDPRNEEYYIQLAQIFLDYNTPEPCIMLLEPVLPHFPSSARIRFVLGVAYLKSSKYKEAQQSLKESLRMQAQNPFARRALAMAYEGDEDWKGLLAFADSMVNAGDSPYESYYYQAEAYYNLYRGQPDHFPEIEGLLRKSLASNPNFAKSCLLMGKLQLDRGSYQDAVQSLKHATTLEPDLAGAYYNLAIAYQKLGDEHRSSEALDRFRTVSQNKKESERSLRYDIVGDPGPTN